MKLFDWKSIFGKPNIVYLPNATDTMAVAGTSFRQAVISAAGLYPFRLIADPKNPHDKNAVMVYLGTRHVGFVPADDASAWSRLVRKLAQEGTVAWVQGEIRQDSEGRWILLTVPPLKQVKAWLKG